MSIINDLKQLDITQFAKVTKTTFCKMDNRPPLALHNWLKIPKGTTIGLLDNVPDKIDPYFSPFNNVRAYVSHGNAYILVTLPHKRIKLIKEK